MKPILKGDNALLAGLSPADRASLRPLLAQVILVKNQVLHERGETIEHVYFVQQGIVSTVADVDTHDHGIEVGLTGPEGLVGSWVLLDQHDSVSYNRQIVQIAGSAQRMSVVALRAAAERSPAIRNLCLRYLRTLIVQTSQTAACNGRHSLSERCARWLLMAHDRVEGNELVLTQEFLSVTLGVRRSGVAEAAAVLQESGAIRYGRGHITVLDRALLENSACNCYRLVRNETDRLAGLVADQTIKPP
jgi:CRP-like cAMP-binding protein